MMARGLPASAALQFALSFSYGLIGMEGFIKSRWRNIAYATRYGKGCTLSDAIGLDTQCMRNYIDALAYCVDQEAKASKPKKR